LAFSYWIDYLGFITKGRLAAVLIIPSLRVPNWSVIYIINIAPSSKFSSTVAGERRRRRSKFSSKFSGAVAGEKEDFCKGSLVTPHFL
jgi:hypothetical protein